jgi:aminoglycoside 3-N-acetyltransferase
MLTVDDFNSALESLGLEKKPAIAHASLRSFGAVEGGAETVLRALLRHVGGLMMPTFTYKTMICPEVGPPNNGLKYGKQRDLNLMAELFHYDMPVDPLMGALPETLRHDPGAVRTAHPILSFAGINVNDALLTQTFYSPFAPIGWLADRDGWVLLLGVDHTVNTSIHYAEKKAGRRRFVRWGLARKRLVECPEFPGCSDGFEAIRADIAHSTRRAELGGSFIEAIPLRALLSAVETRLKTDPLALLCQRDECGRCDALRMVNEPVGE